MHPTVKRAEVIKAAMAEALAQIARERLFEFGRSWVEKFPRCRVSFTFGNGTCYAEVGGRHVYRHARDHDSYLSLKPLYEALDDVEEITDNYELAVPDDVKFGGTPCARNTVSKS
jgi:hypothetical protein